MKKYRVLLSFDFEAVVRLQQWDSLETLVYESTSFADEQLYGVFADVILCSEAPIEEMIGIFKVRDYYKHITLFQYLPMLFLP